MLKEWRALMALQGALCVMPVEEPRLRGQEGGGRFLVIPFGIPPGDTLTLFRKRVGSASTPMALITW